MKCVMRSIAMSLAIWAAAACVAEPFGVAFTYQGQVKVDGEPGSGNFNMEFSLWDAATDGNQVGSTVALAGVPVVEGVFTVPLNQAGEFGPGSFNGEARWLAISVNGTPLTPRQLVTPAPYALFSTAPWGTMGGNIFYNGGNVGVGTSAPTQKLSVIGHAFVQGADGYNSAGETARLYLGDTNTSIRAVHGSGVRISAFNAQDGLVLQQGTGNVGIGTTTPGAPLHVVGANPFPHAHIAAAPTAPFGAFLSLDASATPGGNEYLIFSTGGTAAEGQGKLVFQNFTDGVEAMAITDTGSVGIGTNTPQSQLQVSGVITAGEASVTDGEIVLEDSGTIANNPGIRTNADGDLILRTHSSVGEMTFESGNPEATRMTLLGNGNLGIGTTTPRHKLDVAGRVNVENGVIQRGGSAITATSDLGLYSMVADSWMRFVTNNGAFKFFANSTTGASANPPAGSALMTVTANGHVGIGVDTPAEKLSVLSTSSARAIQGYSNAPFAVWCESTSDQLGAGVVGVNDTSGDSRGVWGQALDGVGVYGYTEGGLVAGVLGRAEDNIVSAGVWGHTSSQLNFGVRGSASGDDCAGVYASTDQNSSVALRAVHDNGGLAGVFEGNVQVYGFLSKGGGSFKIDHPLDPTNKFLSHSFVESPDMMNIYNGQVVTDSRGYATVTMPDWFEPLNRDFRYQLTIVNDGETHDFVQAMIVQKVKDGQFMLKTSKPNVEVSWQVTGIRQDAWANANRVAVETEKPAAERGKYLYPQAHGQPKERCLSFESRPPAFAGENGRLPVALPRIAE